MEETYADIVPVSLTTSRMSAFISVMRGCDNMCSYCIVPFTRGKERSRDIQSILDEVRHLSDQGVKEITLLGQNVNSYRDVSQTDQQGISLSKKDETQLVKGFRTVYKPKKGGLRFADLLDRVSQVNPEIRIRFTSPHPKDFPDEVLYLIKERNNICKQIHLPAQCGSTRILELMRRGYTREAYVELVSIEILAIICWIIVLKSWYWSQWILLSCQQIYVIYIFVQHCNRISFNRLHIFDQSSQMCHYHQISFVDSAQKLNQTSKILCLY